MKNKVEILIFIDEMDNVGCRFTSRNIVTVLGAIETAKSAILKQNELKEQPRIEIPRV